MVNACCSADKSARAVAGKDVDVELSLIKSRTNSHNLTTSCMHTAALLPVIFVDDKWESPNWAKNALCCQTGTFMRPILVGRLSCKCLAHVKVHYTSENRNGVGGQVALRRTKMNVGRRPQFSFLLSSIDVNNAALISTTCRCGHNSVCGLFCIAC
jgi:hypothetical protein